MKNIIFFFFLASCSSTSNWSDFFSSKSDISKKRNQELMEDFKVEEEVVEKFKVVDKPQEKEEPKPEVSKQEKESPKALPQPKKVEPTQKRVAKKEVLKKVVKPEYPEDFPKVLIKFDKESKKAWTVFEPKLIVGEKAAYSITYAGIDTGSITLETKGNTKIGESEVYHLSARIKTSKYYSYLYEVDDICDSYIKMENFIPMKFSMIQRESSQDVDDLQLFDHESLKTYTFYKRVNDDDEVKKKKRTRWSPKFFQDPLSIVYFVRGLPLQKKGITYELPILNKGKAEILEATPKGVEKIRTKLGEVEAYRVDVITHHEGKTLKGGEMSFWYATNNTRMLVGFKAKVKLGAISAELIEYNKF